MGGGPAGVPSGPDEFAEKGTRSYMSQPEVKLDNFVKTRIHFFHFLCFASGLVF